MTISTVNEIKSLCNSLRFSDEHQSANQISKIVDTMDLDSTEDIKSKSLKIKNIANHCRFSDDFYVFNQITSKL